MTALTLTVRRPDFHAWLEPALGLLVASFMGLGIWALLQQLVPDASNNGALQWSVFLSGGIAAALLGVFRHQSGLLVAGMTLLAFPALGIGDVIAPQLVYLALIAPLVVLHPAVNAQARIAMLVPILLIGTGADSVLPDNAGWTLYLFAGLYAVAFFVREWQAPKFRMVVVPTLAALAAVWSSIA